MQIMKRRIFKYLLPGALSLVFSCDKAGQPVVPVSDGKDGAAWQKEQWDACSRELQKHLDTEGREVQLSTLDAAFVAIMKADIGTGDSRTIPFQSGGASCEAVIESNAQDAALKVFREGELVGSFSGNTDSFTGEAAGISLVAKTEGETVLRSRDVVLASLNTAAADPGKTSLQLDLITGISIRGTVDGTRLWNAIRSLQDASSEEQARGFVQEAASAMDLPVYYEGDYSTARAKLTLEPEHILSRYDNYWTWRVVILTVSGETLLLKESSPLKLVFDGTLPFYQAWHSLMPHIVK